MVDPSDEAIASPSGTAIDALRFEGEDGAGGLGGEGGVLGVGGAGGAFGPI